MVPQSLYLDSTTTKSSLDLISSSSLFINSALFLSGTLFKELKNNENNLLTSHNKTSKNIQSKKDKKSIFFAKKTKKLIEGKTIKKIEKQSSFLFINFSSSGNTFSQSSGFYAHGVIPTNFKVQKFSAIPEEVFDNFKIQVFQRKENSYTYLLFSASQHCRISSLRAPPVA